MLLLPTALTAWACCDPACTHTMPRLPVAGLCSSKGWYPVADNGLLSQPFVAVQDCTRRELMPDLTTDIWWTEDGRRLVVRVLMRSRDLKRTSQHIMMVQLGAPEYGFGI